MTPRFRIVSDDGTVTRVVDTVTGEELKTVRIEVSANLYGTRVNLELFAQDQFAIDVAAGEMEPAPQAQDDEPADDPPMKRQPLS